MEKIIVNAMGDQCPIPVIKTRNAVSELKEAVLVEVDVDNETAVQNVSRFAASKGFSPKAEILGDGRIRINLVETDKNTTYELEADGTRVRVEAPADAFDEGTYMEIQNVRLDESQDSGLEAY